MDTEMTPVAAPDVGGPGVKKFNHEKWAEDMRNSPGQWFALNALPTAYAGMIRRGELKAYRPVGDFDVVVRKGTVMACYTGNGVGPATVERRVSKHDHPRVRRMLDAHARGEAVPMVSEAGWLLCADFPQPYASKIKQGRFGYSPAGKYESRHVAGAGVYVRLSPVWLAE